MKKNTFFEKTAAPEPIHLMTEVTSILDSICKTANAGYNNYTKYARDVDDYYQGDPWCAMFISWCMMKTYGRNTAKKLLKDWPYVACRYLPYYLPSYNTPK